VVAGVHAREWHATLAVHKLLGRLLDDPSAESTVDFLPMLNPDGFELSLHHRGWRGNGNHVDLNRNFEVGWGNGDRASDDPTSQNYQGPHKESEAETRVASRIMAKGSYSLVLDVHSAAEKVYGYMPPPDDWTGGSLEAPLLERNMCTVLSQLLRLPVEWLRTPLGTLQCAASGREHAISFTVETAMPKRLPVLFTKFDFSETEAQELASKLHEFLVYCELIWETSEDAPNSRSKWRQLERYKGLLHAPKVRRAEVS